MVPAHSFFQIFKPTSFSSSFEGVVWDRPLKAVNVVERMIARKKNCLFSRITIILILRYIECAFDPGSRGRDMPR